MILRLVSLLFLGTSFLVAQNPVIKSSVDIFEDIQKFQVVGSAMYIAAHPDDENTRVISYLANELKIPTTYLSLTRGDGGQNLIGTEIKEKLGILRTQELLAARRIDGGNQMFSRANDFGYSKSPEETKAIWLKNEVLGDVVWAIRKVQPDIIINRFSHDSGRKTHGHHTSSAQLSVEAYDMVNDKNAFPEQLRYVDTWQPNRLFFNTSWWFYGSREKFADADKSRMANIDIGVYYPEKGMSNNEIAYLSRSQHLCQGFGTHLRRGSTAEYLQLIKGEMPANQEDIIEGIDMSWSRVKGGYDIKKLLHSIEENFDFSAPSNSVTDLLELHSKIGMMPENRWKAQKLKDLEQLILDCSGLFVEAIASTQYAVRGEEISVDMELVNRSPVPMRVLAVTSNMSNTDTTMAMSLEDNEKVYLNFETNIPADATDRSPYWLREEGTLGMYHVPDQEMRGIPENPEIFQFTLDLEVQGKLLKVRVPLRYKTADPAIGEEYFPFDVLPVVTGGLAQEVYIFGDQASKKIKVKLRANRENVAGDLKLKMPSNWSVNPSSKSFEIELKGQEQEIEFDVRPPSGQSVAELNLEMLVEGKIYTQSLDIIDYDHIPQQVLLEEARARMVKIDLKKKGDRVAYIKGAGDKIAENLEAIGYSVDLIEEANFSSANLAQYEAVILGIRAINTQEWLNYVMDDLHDYVKGGGNLIVQYNTSHRQKVKGFSPYELELSRDRVTVEEAEVRIIAPKHAVMNFPNKINASDFNGWVTERGLYFPNKWGSEYKAILSANDPGEGPKDGGLLVAKYGEGNIIYSGYSWFRQLPAGVPGAFRIYANMISLD